MDATGPQIIQDDCTSAYYAIIADGYPRQYIRAGTNQDALSDSDSTTKVVPGAIWENAAT